jgi:hypothetical protein
LFLRSNELEGFFRDMVPNFLRDVMVEAKAYISGDEALATLRRALCELFVKSNEDAYSLVVRT